MSVSPVSLCNRALSAIGTRSDISSLTENSNESNQCALLYDTVRQELLRYADWNFARQIALLTQLNVSPLVAGVAPSDTNPVFWSFMPWAYQYAYPSDCLMFRRVVPVYGMSPFPQASLGTPTVRFEILGDKDAGGNDINTVVTNLAQAAGRYTKDVTNAALFDAGFQDAVVGRLAARLAIPLSGSLDLAKGAIAAGQDAEARARAADGNEGITVQEHTPDWIEVRGSCLDYYVQPGAYPYEFPIFPMYP